MLQKIKMDNRERSRRLAGLVNSCPSYPNPSATTTTTTTSELIGQSPAFDQATTTAAILRPATLEKWVSLDYTHTWHTIQFSGGATGTRNLIFFFGLRLFWYLFYNSAKMLLRLCYYSTTNSLIWELCLLLKMFLYQFYLGRWLNKGMSIVTKK